MTTSSAKLYHLPGHVVLDEPRLRFGSNHPRDTDIHPMRGLLRFGPYSKDKLAAVPNPIRIAMIAPADETERLTNQIREIEQVHQPRERKSYLPSFPGFEKIFGVQLARGGAGTSIELPSDLAAQMAASPKPHIVLAQALTRALFAMRNLRSAYDVVLILLTKDLQNGFRARDEDFDLHDYVKAYAASEGIRVQFLRDDSVSITTADAVLPGALGLRFTPKRVVYLGF